MKTSSSHLPTHVALIMDGNRRWAKRRKLPAFKGHYEGAKTLEQLITRLGDLEQISYLTFWGGSVNNLTVRPKQEIAALFDVYEKWFKKLLEKKELVEKDIRVRIIGDWERLAPASLKRVFKELIEKTKNHQRFNLTFLIAYSGKEEMLEAIKKLSGAKAQLGKVTEDLLRENLWTGDLPPVDLVIRTGIDKNDAPHWSSGFMMWLCADAQFHFTKTCWPDFSIREFKTILAGYAKTQRRFGK